MTDAAAVTTTRAQIHEATKLYWPVGLYDMPPDRAAFALEPAVDAYHAMALVFPAESDERALLRWLAEATAKLMQYKHIEAVSPERARLIFTAARDFVPAEHPEHFVLKAQ